MMLYDGWRMPVALFSGMLQFIYDMLNCKDRYCCMIIQGDLPEKNEKRTRQIS